MVARNLALISISKVAVFIWAHTSNVTFAVNQSTGTTYDGYLVYPQNSNIKMSKLVGRAGSVYKNGRPVIAKKITTGEEIVLSAAEWQSKIWVSQTWICQAHSKVASNSLVVIHSAKLMMKSINANLILSTSFCARLIGITRAFCSTAALLAKALLKPFYGIDFSFHPQLHWINSSYG